ncbi:MAG: SCO family protein [Pseudomonadota bacterium]
MPRRSVLLFAGACIVIAAALVLTTLVMVGRRDPAPTSGVISVTDDKGRLPGGPFQLTDQDGRAVDQSILNGEWTLVFFGFTYCPDYCPTTLAAIDATKRAMGAEGDKLQVLFISVDPERDTPQALKDYLSTDGFPKGVIGLTGTPEQVRAAANAYRAFYSKVGEGPDYTMNHSLAVYLMGPDGQYRTAIAHDLAPDRAAGVIRRALKEG